MLVTFSCSTYADITMFGADGIQMLKLMGHSGEVPSALLAKDVPQAIEKLEAAVEKDKQQQDPQEEIKSLEGEPVVITLTKRALPLIKLLRSAAKAECNVMWEGK